MNQIAEMSLSNVMLLNEKDEDWQNNRIIYL